jgi:hypothetical protein
MKKILAARLLPLVALLALVVPSLRRYLKLERM